MGGIVSRKNNDEDIRYSCDYTKSPILGVHYFELSRETFEKSELGRMKKILPLHEMAENLGQVRKSMAPKRGRQFYCGIY